MSEVVTYCRQCEASCGVVASVDRDQILRLEGDAEHPISRGFLCEAGRESAASARSPSRIKTPMRREGDRLVPVDWERALREAGDRLGQVRRSAGPRSLAIYAGDPVGASAHDVARTAALALAMGTPNLFTRFAQAASPFLYATEQVLGHPMALQSDVARSHYTVLLGGNQQAGSWGPMQGGAGLGEELRLARQGRKSKLVVADPRRTPLAEIADVHLPIRPGTDLPLLLGMLAATLHGGWYDKQFVRDYCVGLDDLRDATAEWSIERAALACGVDRELLSGVALKLARAAMASVHRGRGMLLSGQGTLASFVLIALHAVTANLLRPGGLFESPGMVDLEPLVRALPTSGAPRARISGFPSVLMQLPGSLLAEEILTPGDGQVKALVAISADPTEGVPAPERVDRALAELDLLVCLDSLPTRAHRHARLILPVVHFWERADSRFHDTAFLSHRFTQGTPAVLSPAGEARTVARVLRDLLGFARPPLRGGAWGQHLHLLGRVLGGADLDRWESRGWDLLSDVPQADVLGARHGVYRGDVDRTTWRVSTPNRRLQLAPPAMLRALRGYDLPEADGDRPFFLGICSRPTSTLDQRSVLPTVEVHPGAAARLGAAEGDRVMLVGPGGQAEATVVFDDRLRGDTAIVPRPRPADLATSESPFGILGPNPDPFTGSPAFAGARIAIRRC
jgi:formate dehydrogenase